MSEMIERVARAIAERGGCGSLCTFDVSKCCCRLDARAAINAMRYSDADEVIAIKSGQAIGVDAVLAIEAHDAWIDAALVGEE